jgi:hypothetical protein
VRRECSAGCSVPDKAAGSTGTACAASRTLQSAQLGICVLPSSRYTLCRQPHASVRTSAPLQGHAPPRPRRLRCSSVACASVQRSSILAHGHATVCVCVCVRARSAALTRYSVCCILAHGHATAAGSRRRRCCRGREAPARRCRPRCWTWGCVRDACGMRARARARVWVRVCARVRGAPRRGAS